MMKCKSLVFIPILGTVFFILLISGGARSAIKETWDSEKLLKNADVVAIVVPIKSVDTDMECSLKNVGINGKLIVVKTSVTIKCLLKGKSETKIDIYHHRMETSDIVIVDGPELVSFRTKAVIVKLDKRNIVLPPPQYLVYLREKENKQYSLVTDYLQAQDSVFEMIPPVLSE